MQRAAAFREGEADLICILTVGDGVAVQCSSVLLTRSCMLDPGLSLGAEACCNGPVDGDQGDLLSDVAGHSWRVVVDGFRGER